jgi:hypothetical protein
MVSRGVNVDFRQFWIEKWTEVPFSYFSISQVLLMIKIKTQEAKNKVCKLQEAILYLILTLTKNKIKNTIR